MVESSQTARGDAAAGAAGAAEPSERALLLIMSIDIGDGRSASIEVREGDAARPLADAFAAAHALDPSAARTLEAHIDAQLAQLREEQAAAEEGERAASARPSPRGSPSAAREPERRSSGGARASEMRSGAPTLGELLVPSEASAEQGSPRSQCSPAASGCSGGGAPRSPAASERSGLGSTPRSPLASECSGSGMPRSPFASERSGGGGKPASPRAAAAPEQRGSPAQSHRGAGGLGEARSDNGSAAGLAELGRDGDGKLHISRQLRGAISAGRPATGRSSSARSPLVGAAARAASARLSPGRERHLGGADARGAARATDDAAGAGGSFQQRLLGEAERRRERFEAARDRFGREEAARLEASRVSPPRRSAALLRAAEARVSVGARRANGGTSGVGRARSAGERLHALSAESTARLDAKREAYRLRREAEEAASMGARPRLTSPVSRRLPAVAARPPPWEGVAADRARSLREREAALVIAEVRRMADCTFQPAVCSRSERLVRRRHAAPATGADPAAAGADPAGRRARSAGALTRPEVPPGFAGLVEDAARRSRQARERALAEQREAQRRARQYRGEAPRAAAFSPAREERLFRLAYSRRVSEAEVGALREFLHWPVDRQTGQPLFTPAVNAAPVPGRETAPGDGAVFDLLYGAAVARAEHLDARAAKAFEDEAGEAARALALRPHSERLAAERRARGLEPLFRLLAACAAPEEDGGALGAADDLRADLALAAERAREGALLRAPLAEAPVRADDAVDVGGVRWGDVAGAVCAQGVPPRSADDLCAHLRARLLAARPDGAPADGGGEGGGEDVPAAAAHWLTFRALVGALAPRARELAAAHGNGLAVRTILGMPGARGGSGGSRRAPGGGEDSYAEEEGGGRAASFQPEVRGASRALAARRRAARGERGPLPERLHSEHARRLQALSERQRQHAQSEVDGCSFAPAIDSRSHELARKAPATEGSVYSRLYAQRPDTPPRRAADEASDEPQPDTRRARAEPVSPPHRALQPTPAQRARADPTPRPLTSSKRGAGRSERRQPATGSGAGYASRRSPALDMSRQLTKLMSPFSKIPTGQREELHGASGTARWHSYAARAAGRDPSGGGGCLAARLSEAAEAASPMPRPWTAGGAPQRGRPSPQLAPPQPAGLAAAAAESEEGTLQGIEDRFYRALSLRLGARP